MKKTLILTALAIAGCQSQNIQEPASAAGAYMIVSGKNYDVKDLGAYAKALPPIYEKYGGRYVAFTPNYITLEGQPDAQAIIISAWPDAKSAEKFWTSPEYIEAKKLRDGIGEFEVVILPALP